MKKDKKKEDHELDDQTINIFSVVSEIVEKESDRMWTRFNSFYLITSSFLGLNLFVLVQYFEQNKTQIEMLLICASICIVGIALSIVWYKILGFSIEWQNRWIKDQIKIIKSNQALDKLIKGRKFEELNGEINLTIQKKQVKIIKSPPVIFLVIFSLFFFLILRLLICF